MPNISFGSGDRATFPTKYHGDVTLSKGKWETICQQPERKHYQHNGDKIATTLINPDNVRHHSREKTQFFYYKKFDIMELDKTISGIPPHGVYFAVVIDVSTMKICTVYPVEKPKPGKEYKP